MTILVIMLCFKQGKNSYECEPLIEQNIKNNSFYCTVMFFNKVTVAVTAWFFEYLNMFKSIPQDDAR